MSAFSFDPSAEENKSLNGPQDYAPLPDAVYDVTVEKAELKEAQAGPQSTYLSLTFRVTDGPFSGRKVFARHTQDNPSEKARNAGRGKTKNFLTAAGHGAVSDTSELVGLSCKAHVVIKPASGGYPAGNDVASYKPLEEARPSPAASTGTPSWKKAK